MQPHPRVGGHFRRAARWRRDGPAGLHRPACRPACLPRADPCKHASTSPNIPGRGGEGEGRQGRKGEFFPPHPPSLRAGGVGEGRPRPPEAAVRSRQGGQTWVRCKNRAAAAATAHGFTQQQQQLSLPMWLEPKAERPLRWGPDALQSQTSGQPMQREGVAKLQLAVEPVVFFTTLPTFYSTLLNRTSSNSPEWLPAAF